MSRKIPLLLNVTTTATGQSTDEGADKVTFQAYGTTSSGTGAATIEVQVSNDNTNFLTLGTITLTLGTSATSDGFSADAAWIYTRAKVTAISGTNATVSCNMGV